MFAIRSATAEEVETIDQILIDLAPHAAGRPLNLTAAALFEAMTNVLAEMDPDGQTVLVRAISDELFRRFPVARGN